MNIPLARRAFMALITLSLAALACDSPFEPAPDTAATVNAISTSVQQTLAPVGVTVVANSPTPGNTPTPLISNPTPISSLTPLASLSPPLSSPTPDGPLRRPNGELISADDRAGQGAVVPNIDGDIGEWELVFSVSNVVFQPANWSGTNDNSARFATIWTTENLYLAVKVIDDIHVQTQSGKLLYQGDSLELQFDADLAGDFASTLLSGDDFQLGLSPGDFAGIAPEAYLWNPSAKTGVPTSVIVMAKATTDGYTLEAAIPWALFNVTPTMFTTYGLALNVSDNDTPGTAEQQSMISSSPARRLTDPTTWGTLILDQ